MSLTQTPPDNEFLAKRLYDKYCEEVGGIAFNGDPLPNSEEFFADETNQKQANAWRATAKEAIAVTIDCLNNF